MDTGRNQRHDDDQPSEGPALESLRLTRLEARAVLETQVETLHTLERKSAETHRLNSLVTGVVLTLASRFAGSDTTPPVDRFAIWSSGIAIIFTFVSFVFAFLTWTGSGKETGPGSSDIQRLVDSDYSERVWLSLLLRSYAAWI